MTSDKSASALTEASSFTMVDAGYLIWEKMYRTPEGPRNLREISRSLHN